MTTTSEPNPMTALRRRAAEVLHEEAVAAEAARKLALREEAARQEAARQDAVQQAMWTAKKSFPRTAYEALSAEDWTGYPSLLGYRSLAVAWLADGCWLLVDADRHEMALLRASRYLGYEVLPVRNDLDLATAIAAHSKGTAG